MADRNPDTPPPVYPEIVLPNAATMAPDELQRQRQAELQAAADRYALEQKHMQLAHRDWQNRREHSHINLMSQLPKLIGAAVFGAVLGYVLPLGDDR